jgi:hypothetical protein
LRPEAHSYRPKFRIVGSAGTIAVIAHGILGGLGVGPAERGVFVAGLIYRGRFPVPT